MFSTRLEIIHLYDDVLTNIHSLKRRHVAISLENLRKYDAIYYVFVKTSSCSCIT